MLTNWSTKSAFLLAATLALAACGADKKGAPPEAPPAASDAASAAVTIPASLAPFGEGYPSAGGPCRNLGESPATSNYLDDSAILVGCPDAEAAAALGGTVVATIDGVTLVSISTGDANAGLAEMLAGATPDVEGGDALVPGTDYHATTLVSCGFGGAEPSGDCPAGVKRNRGEAGNALVEVTKPDGSKRAIYFRGTTPFGADSAEADGSAGWTFEVTRSGDRSVIKFGPETYVIVDAFIVGG
jgi:hypothetical protein